MSRQRRANGPRSSGHGAGGGGGKRVRATAQNHRPKNVQSSRCLLKQTLLLLPGQLSGLLWAVVSFLLSGNTSASLLPPAGPSDGPPAGPSLGSSLL